MKTEPLGYLVTFDSPAGLLSASEGTEQEIPVQNGRVIQRNFRRQMEILLSNGLLDGMNILWQQENTGQFAIDGKGEKIQRLRDHLRTQKIGDLVENIAEKQAH